MAILHPEPVLPDDLNPEVVAALATLIGAITGLKPPPANHFPPEWYGPMREFYARVCEIARLNLPVAGVNE
jgi:hypothetical protein